MSQVLLLVDDIRRDSELDLGLGVLRDFEISFEVRLASPLGDPEQLSAIAEAFRAGEGKVLICFGDHAKILSGAMSAYLETPILSVTADPALDKFSKTQAAFTPFAEMASGREGVREAVLFALQILSLSNPELGIEFARYRQQQKINLRVADQKIRLQYQG